VIDLNLKVKIFRET